MIVIIDTREQRGWSFDAIAAVTGTTRRKLDTGDYSAVGLESIACIERKSLADFAATVTRGRARFNRELDRMTAFRFRAVIIDASIADVYRRDAYQTRVSPDALMSHAASIMWGNGTPVFFAGSRAESQILCYSILRAAAKSC